MKNPFAKSIILLAMIVFVLISCESKNPVLLKKENEYHSLKLFNDVEPTVRVRIINTLKTVDIRFLTDWSTEPSKNVAKQNFRTGDVISVLNKDGLLRISSNEQLFKEKLDSLKLSSAQAGAELEIKEVPYGTGWWWAGRETRRYEGMITLYPTEEGFVEVVVQLPMEKYLSGVVPYEIGGDSPLEALKAQAVAARSEAVIALQSNLYNGPHHDLTSDVECQVFSGNKKRTEASDRAVAQTRGLILAEEGEPINAYYASNCGGHSELIKNVWPERKAFNTYEIAGKDKNARLELDLSTETAARQWIESEPDVYCNPNLETELPAWSRKNFRWQRKLYVDSLTKMVSNGKGIGRLLEIKPLQRGLSGRIYQARFIFEQDSFDVNGELAVRQLWQPSLRSACFVVDKKEEFFVIRGAGWGHGVGMCQSGAVAQARQGKSFQEILKHYYQKADLVQLY